MSIITPKPGLLSASILSEQDAHTAIFTPGPSSKLYESHEALRAQLEEAMGLLREWMSHRNAFTYAATDKFLSQERSGARPEQQLAAGGESDGVARQGSTTVTDSQRATAGENPAPVTNEGAEALSDDPLDRMSQDPRLLGQVLLDIHDSLGIKWGDDPYSAIGALRVKLQAAKQALNDAEMRETRWRVDYQCEASLRSAAIAERDAARAELAEAKADWHPLSLRAEWDKIKTVKQENEKLKAELAEARKPENRGIGDGDIVALLREREGLVQWGRGAAKYLDDSCDCSPGSGCAAGVLRSQAPTSVRARLEGEEKSG